MIKYNVNAILLGFLLMLSASGFAQKAKQQKKVTAITRQTNLSDSALLDVVQKKPSSTSGTLLTL